MQPRPPVCAARLCEMTGKAVALLQDCLSMGMERPMLHTLALNYLGENQSTWTGSVSLSLQ